MRHTGDYAAVLLLLGSLTLLVGSRVPETSPRPLGRATARKLTPELRDARQRTAHLSLQVQFHPPARANDYLALRGAGARLIERDYARAAARIRLPSWKLLALLALPQVQAVRLGDTGAE